MCRIFVEVIKGGVVVYDFENGFIGVLVYLFWVREYDFLFWVNLKILFFLLVYFLFFMLMVVIGLCGVVLYFNF